VVCERLAVLSKGRVVLERGVGRMTAGGIIRIYESALQKG
jgi:hypothetical protein